MRTSALDPCTYLSVGSGNESERRPRYSVHPIFRESHSHVLRDGSFQELGDGARIFLAPVKSRCQAQLARALRMSRGTEAVTGTLQLGRSLIRTVTLKRSLKRAPFKRTKRFLLGRICRNKFRRGRRDMHVMRGLRGSKRKLGLA